MVATHTMIKSLDVFIDKAVTSQYHFHEVFHNVALADCHVDQLELEAFKFHQDKFIEELLSLGFQVAYVFGTHQYDANNCCITAIVSNLIK